jgi:nicotinate-nucleotide--dimethylbenzimidazole phosphoribosyltransferase
VKPDWLAVPAADPAACPAWRLSWQDEVRVASLLRPVGSYSLTANRPGDVAPEGAGRDWKSVCRIRVVLLVAERAPVSMSRNGTRAAALGARPRDGGVLSTLLDSLEHDIEILGLGTPVRFGPCASSPKRAPCHRRPLDKHRLDVALSLGRHAAERAKLAGRELLVGLGQDWRGRTSDALRADPAWRASLADAPYEALRRLGSRETAVCVGALIAGAQIGLPVLLQGRYAAAARRVACCLHPRLGEWLSIADGMSRFFATWAPSDTSCLPGSAVHSIMVDAHALAPRKASV